MKKGQRLELFAWITALILLALTDPNSHHFTLCPFSNLGITCCPGCGLGRSITFIFYGDFRSSFGQHWFGIPALLILLCRIVRLTKDFKLPTQLPLNT